MDNQDNKKRITVVIAGRPYSLKVKTEDEPVILRLTKEINVKIRQFQSTYANKDKQDLLAMTLLNYSVDLHPLADSLQAIDNLLDDLLVD